MNDLVAELETIDLGDQRLNCRARRVLAKLGAKPQASIPAACGGWAETRAAYRWFDHPNVTAQQILEPHYWCSDRSGSTGGCCASRTPRKRTKWARTTLRAWGR